MLRKNSQFYELLKMDIFSAIYAWIVFMLLTEMQLKKLTLQNKLQIKFLQIYIFIIFDRFKMFDIIC